MTDREQFVQMLRHMDKNKVKRFSALSRAVLNTKGDNNMESAKKELTSMQKEAIKAVCKANDRQLTEALELYKAWILSR